MFTQVWRMASTSNEYIFTFQFCNHQPLPKQKLCSRFLKFLCTERLEICAYNSKILPFQLFNFSAILARLGHSPDPDLLPQPKETSWRSSFQFPLTSQQQQQQQQHHHLPRHAPPTPEPFCIANTISSSSSLSHNHLFALCHPNVTIRKQACRSAFLYFTSLSGPESRPRRRSTQFQPLPFNSIRPSQSTSFRTFRLKKPCRADSEATKPPSASWYYCTSVSRHAQRLHPYCESLHRMRRSAAQYGIEEYG